MDKNLVPAPIDNKNVTTDWIPEIFDFGDCTTVNCKDSQWRVCGYVNCELVECIYYHGGNKVYWSIYALYSVLDNTKAELMKRLKKYETDESNIYSEFDEKETSVCQKFYWKED